jgi:hypothetical protein
VRRGQGRRREEVALGRHREELGRVGRGVVAEHRRHPGGDRLLVAGVGRAAHRGPARGLVTGRQGRRAVDLPGRHVELVGELVEHHVAASAGATTGDDRVPRQHHRSAQHRLADHRRPVLDRRARLFEQPERPRRLAQGRRVDQHRADIGVEVGLGPPEDQQAGLGRDRHHHLLGHLEATTPDPLGLGHEVLSPRQELGSPGRRQPARQGDVAVEVVVPARRRRTGGASTSTIAEPRQHGSKLRPPPPPSTRRTGRSRAERGYARGCRVGHTARVRGSVNVTESR